MREAGGGIVLTLREKICWKQESLANPATLLQNMATISFQSVRSGVTECCSEPDGLPVKSLVAVRDLMRNTSVCMN